MDEINVTGSGTQEGAVASPDTMEASINPSDDGQTGAVAPENNDGSSEADGTPPEGQPQSRADNQAARLARLAAERQARESIARAEEEAQSRVNAELARMGLHDPETGEEISDLKGLQSLADRLEAQRRNIPPEAFAELREAQAKAEALQAQVDSLRQVNQERLRADDLAKIREAFPDSTEVKAAKAITDLGEDFIRLMAAQESMGLPADPVATYALAESLRAKNLKPVPPTIGSVKAGSSGPSEFFSEAELDALTEEQLRDPKIQKKAEESMLRLARGNK